MLPKFQDGRMIFFFIQKLSEIKNFAKIAGYFYPKFYGTLFKEMVNSA